MYENIRWTAEEILQKIQEISKEKKQVIVAIDGRCGSGKTTLAKYLQKLCDCNVIPMDHFFLRPQQRTKERLLQPGGNVDYERFEKEVLCPLCQGKAFVYRPYSCREQKLLGECEILSKKITVVEGSYSCHPKLKPYYDLKVFLSVGEREQLRRIELRNGKDSVEIFRTRWIPMEEQYFEYCRTQEGCDMHFFMDESIPSGYAETAH